jgi:GDP-L-fucose synthase
VNIGSGQDDSIRGLAETIASVVGYDEEFEWDTAKPTGTPRKLLDISRIKRLGWEPKTPLREGIAKTYAWFLEHVASR